MKKVISFSLWGDKAIYNIGAIKNAELAEKMYPEFECWYYIHKDSVPQKTIDELSKFNNVKIILRSGNINMLNPMLWRFESIDDPNVEINLSRDLDSRILLRENLAVREWIKSGKLFHIMRDHPHHMNPNTKIMGGMFGTRKIPTIISWKELYKSNTLDDLGRPLYNRDQQFLNKFIYPSIVNNCMIHSSFGIFKNEINTLAKKFPIEYCNEYKHVGGYVYEDESLSIEHTNIIKRQIL